MPFSLLARETVWAARRLSRAPGFVAVAVLTLAVGIVTLGVGLFMAR